MNALSLWSWLDHAGYAAMRALLAALWQSSILLAAVGVLATLLRKRRASVRHALWAGGLLLTPLLPLFAALVLRSGAPQAPVRILPEYAAPIPAESYARAPDAAMPAAAAMPVAAMPTPVPVVPADPPPRVSPLDRPWALALLAYTAGVCGFLAWIFLGRARIRGWIRSATPLMEERVLAAFNRAKRTVGLQRDFVVLQSDRAPASVSLGTLHPIVLLPKGLAARLSDSELEALAIHEIAHLRRNDPLTLLLVALVRAALFFHPLVWLAGRRLSTLAEQAADDVVLEATGAPVPYAKLLARLAEELPRRAVSTELAAGIVLSKGAFLRRIEAILSDRRDRIRRLSRLALAATLLLSLLSLTLAVAVPLGEKGKNDAAEICAAAGRQEVLRQLPARRDHGRAAGDHQGSADAGAP